MGISLEVTCDGCGEKRKKTNHWFKVSVGQNPLRLTVAYWPPNQKVLREGTKIYCGQACLHTAIDQLIAKPENFSFPQKSLE